MLTATLCCALHSDLKEDSCGGVMHGTTYQQYSRMRDALNKTGACQHSAVVSCLQCSH